MWVTDFSLIIQKVDIHGSFCYTTELVAAAKPFPPPVMDENIAKRYIMTDVFRLGGDNLFADDSKSWQYRDTASNQTFCALIKFTVHYADNPVMNALVAESRHLLAEIEHIRKNIYVREYLSEIVSNHFSSWWTSKNVGPKFCGKDGKGYPSTLDEFLKEQAKLAAERANDSNFTQEEVEVVWKPEWEPPPECSRMKTWSQLPPELMGYLDLLERIDTGGRGNHTLPENGATIPHAIPLVRKHCQRVEVPAFANLTCETRIAELGRDRLVEEIRLTGLWEPPGKKILKEQPKDPPNPNFCADQEDYMPEVLTADGSTKCKDISDRILQTQLAPQKWVETNCDMPMRTPSKPWLDKMGPYLLERVQNDGLAACCGSSKAVAATPERYSSSGLVRCIGTATMCHESRDFQPENRVILTGLGGGRTWSCEKLHFHILAVLEKTDWWTIGHTGPG